MTYDKLLKQASDKALAANKEVEAVKLLLMELSDLTPSELYLSMKKEAPETFVKLFNEKADLYIDEDVPVQHILGYSYFYGRKFIVNENTLIPRPETEQLVEHVLYFYDTYFDSNVKVVDLGTGSGCIALTLALEESRMDVEGYDISEEALKVTKENAKALDANVKLGVSDWFSNVTGKFDIIVANPPYIPDSELVSDVVTKEPSVALYGGAEGLDYYETILKNAKNFLNEKGLIAFEHGYQQKEKMHALVKKYFSDAVIVQYQDLAMKDRFTFVGIGGVLSNEI